MHDKLQFDQQYRSYTAGADTGFGRGRGQDIFRWDNSVSREATYNVLIVCICEPVRGTFTHRYFDQQRCDLHKRYYGRVLLNSIHIHRTRCNGCNDHYVAYENTQTG